MAYYENSITKDHGNKKSIQVLASTAKTISTCGKDIQTVADNIMISCDIPGTKGVAYRNQLLAKVDDLKKLAILYNSASQQLIGAAGKLASGVPEDEVWTDVLV